MPPSEEQMAFKQTQEAFDASGDGLVPLLSSPYCYSHHQEEVRKKDPEQI
jgi:hypothetical protein